MSPGSGRGNGGTEDVTADDLFASLSDEFDTTSADSDDVYDEIAGESPEEIIASADEDPEDARERVADAIRPDEEALDVLLLSEREEADGFLWVSTNGEAGDEDPTDDEDASLRPEWAEAFDEAAVESGPGGATGAPAGDAGEDGGGPSIEIDLADPTAGDDTGATDPSPSGTVESGGAGSETPEIDLEAADEWSSASATPADDEGRVADAEPEISIDLDDPSESGGSDVPSAAGSPSGETGGAGDRETADSAPSAPEDDEPAGASGPAGADRATGDTADDPADGSAAGRSVEGTATGEPDDAPDEAASDGPVSDPATFDDPSAAEGSSPGEPGPDGTGSESAPAADEGPEPPSPEELRRKRKAQREAVRQPPPHVDEDSLDRGGGNQPSAEELQRRRERQRGEGGESEDPEPSDARGTADAGDEPTDGDPPEGLVGGAQPAGSPGAGSEDRPGAGPEAPPEAESDEDATAPTLDRFDVDAEEESEEPGAGVFGRLRSVLPF